MACAVPPGPSYDQPFCPPHGPALQRGQLRPVLPSGLLHQTLACQGVGLLLVEQEALRVEGPAVPHGLAALLRACV
ncbi:hypothetical protein ABZ402_50375 [Streptomyces mirabilis]|uniref:hypothetical protein n=1 Tax=Streptomyces mirabilis TaxID=68239 RepID=UPI00340B266D